MWALSDRDGKNLRRVGKEKGRVTLLNETSLSMQTYQNIIGNRFLDEFPFATMYVFFHHPHILRVWVENKHISLECKG